VHTSFTFKLHDVRDVTTFDIVWPPGKQIELLSALQAVQLSNAKTISARTKARPMEAGPRLSRNQLLVETIGVYWGSANELRDILAPAFAIAAPQVTEIYEVDYWRARDYLLTDDPVGMFHIKCNYVQRDSNSILKMEASWAPIDGDLVLRAQQEWLASYHSEMQRFVPPESYVNFPDRDLRAEHSVGCARSTQSRRGVTLPGVKRNSAPRLALAEGLGVTALTLGRQVLEDLKLRGECTLEGGSCFAAGDVGGEVWKRVEHLRSGQSA
jgi:hypothetical protein